jgi:hypothetical protein
MIEDDRARLRRGGARHLRDWSTVSPQSAGQDTARPRAFIGALALFEFS